MSKHDVEKIVKFVKWLNASLSYAEISILQVRLNTFQSFTKEDVYQNIWDAYQNSISEFRNPVPEWAKETIHIYMEL